MIILEKNAKLTTMLAYAKEHIDLGDLDPAANVLRKGINFTFQLL